MLPSLGARIVSIFGIISGCFAVFLSEWGIEGVSDILWKACAALAVCALFAMRLMPGKVVNMTTLRSRVGNLKIDRVINQRRLAIGLVFICLILAVMVSPFIQKIGERRLVLLTAFIIFGVSIGLFGVVEANFRSLLTNADMTN